MSSNLEQFTQNLMIVQTFNANIFGLQKLAITYIHDSNIESDTENNIKFSLILPTEY